LVINRGTIVATAEVNRMVHIRDEGSRFDASIETVWRYLNTGDLHGKVHTSSRNRQVKTIGDVAMMVALERNWNGEWVKEVSRVTVMPPLGVTTEILEGPLAGSKMFTVYSPEGLERTRVEVFGEFRSPKLPAEQVESAVRKWLEDSYNEDAPALKSMQTSPKESF
jgi:hypothetical protein